MALSEKPLSHNQRVLATIREMTAAPISFGQQGSPTRAEVVALVVSAHRAHGMLVAAGEPASTTAPMAASIERVLKAMNISRDMLPD